MSACGKDPESARNAEQIDIKRLPPKIQKVLDKYDVDGDGTITAAEFVIAMEQHEATKDSLAKQKKIVLLLVAFRGGTSRFGIRRCVFWGCLLGDRVRQGGKSGLRFDIYVID